MIHYSLVYILFFCDRELARLGIYTRMELRKKNETAFYFRIPEGCELKENEFFALSSYYPRTVRPILIMFYFGGTYTVLSKIVPMQLSVYVCVCVCVFVCVRYYWM